MTPRVACDIEGDALSTPLSLVICISLLDPLFPNVLNVTFYLCHGGPSGSIEVQSAGARIVLGKSTLESYWVGLRRVSGIK